MFQKAELLDKEVQKKRIEENLNQWEIGYTKYPGLPYNKGASQFLHALNQRYGAIRLILKEGDAKTNERRAYHFAKLIINGGVSPSNVCIVSLEDCYLSVRGFGDHAKTKEKIFRNQNEMIIIEGMREIRATDVKDNVYSFWQEFWAYCRKNRNLHVLLPFDSQTNLDWYPRETNKVPHKELHFTYLAVEQNKK